MTDIDKATFPVDIRLLEACSLVYPNPSMVKMNFEGDEKGRDTRTLSVMDPSVGTGRFLMYASNYSLNLYGQDIDRTCVMATKINAYLYMPWLIRPAPWLAMTETIKHTTRA